MSSDEVRIVEIRPNGDVFKDPETSSYVRAQGAWVVPVVYILEDGHVVRSRERFGLKRDAVAFRVSLPCPPKNPTFACFNDGKYWGTSIRYNLGG